MGPKTSSSRAAAIAATAAMAALVYVGAGRAAEAQPTPGTAAGSANADLGYAPGSASPQIVALCDAQGQEIDGRTDVDVGLDDVLWVVIGNAGGARTSNSRGACQAPGEAARGAAPPTTTSGGRHRQAAPPLAADRYVLFLNGEPLPGLTYTAYDNRRNALGFRLTRNAANRDVWARLLGSPTSLTRTARVALGEKSGTGGGQPTIFGTGTSATFQLRIMSVWRLIIAVGVTVLLLAVMLGHVRARTTLRDDLLPQLEPKRQPYSLGRCQMAFWFVLVFISFVFLYLLLGDYNTLSGQALALMGIASATAFASVAVDVAKDSPADKANRALQALGLGSYEDVARLETEIGLRTPLVSGVQNELAGKSTAATEARMQARRNPGDREREAAASAAEAEAGATANRLMQLHAEIQDRRNILRTYREKSEPFASQGWFKDLTTDLNGPTLHRLQVIFWTAALGVVFLIEVYRHLAMPPDFSPTLLALLGISGAGYVGFKYPEKND